MVALCLGKPLGEVEVFGKLVKNKIVRVLYFLDSNQVCIIVYE